MGNPKSPSERQWGYRFGVDGVVTAKAAAEMLSCSTRTIQRRAAEGLLRRGHLRPGCQTSPAVVCRRSLNDYLDQMES